MTEQQDHGAGDRPPASLGPRDARELQPRAPADAAASGVGRRRFDPTPWLTPPGFVAMLAIAYSVVLALVFVLRPAGDDGARLLSDFGELPVQLAAIALALAVVHDDDRPRARLAWALMTLAFAADTVGNLVYAAYDLADATPFPSIADVFYLAFYPLLLAGLLLLPTASRRRDVLEWRAASNIAIVIVGGGMAVLHFMLAPVLPDLGDDPLSSVVLLAYPVGDLALLAALATISTRRPFAGDRQTIAWIAFAIAAWLAGDIVYAIITANGATDVGSISDVLYAVGDLGFLLAAWSSIAGRRLRDGDRPLPLPVASRVGPYVMLMLGLVTLVAASISTYQEIAILAVMAVGLTSLVVVRQLADENERRRFDARLLEAHRAAAEEAEARALHDPLTGLVNRAGLDDLLRRELSTSAATGRPVTIAFADLNAFKAVNDTLGHAAGDELLVAVGHRLNRAVRAGDTVVRLGGDEFAIVLPGTASHSALDIVSRAASTLDEPFAIAGASIRANGAFGLATSEGVGVDDLDPLLSRADTAMYRAKRLSLGPTLFDPSVDASLAPVRPILAPQATQTTTA